MLIASIQLSLKYTTDTTKADSYFHLHLEIDNECGLRTTLYDKEMISIFPLDTFQLYIVTFSLWCLS